MVEAGAALDDLCRRLASIVAESGPDAVGLYIGTGGFQGTAGSSVALRLAAELGTRSLYTPMTIDGVAKHVVHQMVTGASGLHASIDLDHATLAVFWGCNPVVSHGHDWGLADPIPRLRELSARGEVWVFDPRRTETARLADRHVQLRPGSDHVVLASVVRELLADGYDAAYADAYVEGIVALRAAVEPFTIEVASAAAGVSRQDLDDFVAAIRRHGWIAAVTGTGATFAEPRTSDRTTRTDRSRRSTARAYGLAQSTPAATHQLDNARFRATCFITGRRRTARSAESPSSTPPCPPALSRCPSDSPNRMRISSSATMTLTFSVECRVSRACQ